MRYYIILTCAILLPLVALAQRENPVMKIHRGGEITRSFPVSEIDSITFGAAEGEVIEPSYSELKVKHVYGDGATYCAFTSLIKRDGIYYLAFREAETHVAPGDYGVIRIMQSTDGDTWMMKQTLMANEIDLRDPDLSIMPNGKLMLICGARLLDKAKNLYVTRTYCAFENEDGLFSYVQPANLPIEVQWETSSWVWRVTWHKGVGYGVCYGGGLSLLKTTNGMDFELINHLDISGNPNECQIRFSDNGTAYMLVRRSGKDGRGTLGYLGKSVYPYEDWEWMELGVYIAGEDFVIDGNKLVVCTRMTQNIGDRTSVWFGNLEGQFNWCYTLPYGGEMGKSDTAYAGMLNEDNEYWVSYYAIHEGEKPSIYIARLPKNVFPM